ncbi:PRC-barrel domain-containing protein [Candidatus Parvarchaeota archaeon]|jgi:sporulation protein YlmC with PRC-barrel domain|nr:PRC-barrel domain-containing protein [Candidatus Parvarchaeota archaeon]MCL4376267.1 PRC-barrel domain-containing protein [Candidatus Parvarchaeota archaeon]MCL5976446.1 PRC-barrel domain-containing protein [Candidatus Parvarchaeota archaeon]
MAGVTKGEKIDARTIVGKTIVGKSGKKIGIVQDLIYEVRTGELVYLSVKNPTSYANTFQFEKDENGFEEIPYSAVISIGDFVVVAEEDII